MKTKIIILVLIMFLTFDAHAQFFIRNYSIVPSSTNMEAGYSLEPSSTLYNMWTIAGSTNNPSQSWLFFKMNSAGVFLGGMTLGYLGNGLSYCHSHVKMSANNYDILAGGYSTGFLYSRKASWSMVDESNMTHIISKRIIDTSYSEYLGVARDNNNNFMPVGYIYKNMGSLGILYKMLAAKYDQSQNLVWAFALKTSQATNDYCYSVCYQPYDDSWAITGTLDYTGKIFILKLSQSGGIIWFKTFTPYLSAYTFNNADSRKIIAMPDGSFMIAGWVKQQGSANTDVLLSRISSQGSVVWSYMYGTGTTSEYGYSIDRSLNGNVIILTGSISNDVLNMQLDGTNGSITWAKRRINNNWGVNTDIGYDVEYLKYSSIKGSYYFTGQIEQNISSGLNTLFMRTKPDGSINSSCLTDVPLVKSIVKMNVDSIPLIKEALLDVQIYPIATSRTVTTYAQCLFHSPDDNATETKEEKYGLEQNYPNPFNPKTQITFSVPAEGSVSIKIFDINGKLVEELVNNQYMNAGTHLVEFDGANFASGMYFYKLDAGKFSDIKKMLLIK